MRATGIAVLVVTLLLVVTVAIMATVRGRDRPATAAPAHLVSMQEGGAAMQRAGEVMQAHGQAMLDEGRRTADPDLIAHGEHWLRDGQALIQGGRWMMENPTAPGSLVSSQAELQAQGSWRDLNRTAENMLHDPSRARQIDLEALRWNGMAMRGEGQIMAEHGRIMAEEVEVMIARHGLQGQTAADMRQAADVMREVGGHLMQNGQEMMEYAERLRRSMGKR